MRSNPRVCLEIDERPRHYRWLSIVVLGRYEELREPPACERARAHALELLQRCENLVAAGERLEAQPGATSIHLLPHSRSADDCAQSLTRSRLPR